VLSGGEKARLALAKMLLRPANFLVLDEPTSHLAIDACEVLEEALADYAGTLMLISHDRSFLNALATRVVDVRAGVLTPHLGNYDDYLRTSAGAATAAPPDAGPEAEEDRDAAKRARIEQRQAAKDRDRRLARARRRATELEQEIPRVESQLTELDWRAAEPDVYRDGEAMRAVEAERAGLRQALEALYAEWEALTVEVESLEASGD